MPLSGESNRQRRGVVVEMPTTSPHWNKQVQRAEDDGTGSPATGTETILETIPGSRTRYVDTGAQESFTAGTDYIYRYRFTRIGASDGSWSGWTAAQTPSDLSGQSSPPKDARALERGDSDNAGTERDLLADILKYVLGSGHLNDNARQNTGGEIRQLARGVLTGQHADGSSVDFTQAVPGGFADVPTVIIMPGGRTQRNVSGDLFMLQKASGLNELGFTMRAYLQEPGTTTAEDDDFPAGTLTQDGDALSLAGQTEGQDGGSGLTATDKDGTYTVRVSGSATAASGGNFVSVQVTMTVQSWDGDLSSPAWEDERQVTRTASADNNNQSTNNFSEEIEFTNGDIGSGDDIRVIVSIAILGDDEGSSSASVDPNDVQYTSSGSATDHSMSPNGETVRWWAFEGV